MELRHLRYFIAVAEEGHFGRAAQRLHIVQPALSMQIRALEEEVGGMLFVRSSRRVELTEAGALLLIEARRTLAQAERAKSIVQDSLRGGIGSVRLGFAGNAVLAGKLVNDLRDFAQRFPAVDIELNEISPQRQAAAILDGEIDLGYSPGVGLSLPAEIVADKVGEWKLLVALSIDHPLARKKRISIKSLDSESLIVYANNDSEHSLVYFSEQPVTPLRSARRMGSTLSILALAAAGLGVALVPEPVVAVDIPNLTYRPIIEQGMSADLLLLHRAGETNGAVKAFVALALEKR